MTDRPDSSAIPRGSCLAIAAAFAWTIASGAAWPQATAPQPVPSPPAQAQVAPPDQPPAPPAPPPPPENPGLINEMGKVLEKSLSILPPLKSPTETLENLNSRAKDAVKDAGESLSRLTKPSSIVTGRIQCPPSANGASDCKAAADKLCQSKGFKEGKSIGTDAVEACSAKVLIPGRTRKADDCRTDNFVTRALCQ